MLEKTKVAKYNPAAHQHDVAADAYFSGVGASISICGDWTEHKYPRKLISGKEFLHMKCRAVFLEVTKPSICRVKVRAPYGISVRRRPGTDKTFFVVSNLYPAGSIQKWNQEFPDMKVSVGDIVREVDGVKGSALEVQKMLANDPDKEKELLVFRFPQCPATKLQRDSTHMKHGLWL